MPAPESGTGVGDAVDAPLVLAYADRISREGGHGATAPHVRLQFEGWPAIQFGGWPYVGVGSFAGQVSFVDPTDDGKGKFRVMVIPDPAERGGTWPEAQFLRQGSQARGWILLDRVRLGYEIWRQLNGFPPRLPDDKVKPDVARKRVK